MEAAGVWGDDLYRADDNASTPVVWLTLDRGEMDEHKCDLAWPAELAGPSASTADRDCEKVLEKVKPDGPHRDDRSAGHLLRVGHPHHGCARGRPVVMALSNPTAKSEAIPEDVFAWTERSCADGDREPVPCGGAQGKTLHVSQGNNVYVFPGVGLGAIVTGARKVTDGMFAAAANASGGPGCRGGPGAGRAVSTAGRPASRSAG